MTETPITMAEAIEAVGKFGAMEKFSFVDDAGRTAVIESLLELVNAPCPEHKDDYCECPRPILRNPYGEPIKTPPSERLRIFAKAFKRIPGGWSGIGEMEALYCSLFPAGDGIDRGCPQTPGYGWNDHAAGTHATMLPPAPEPVLALPPGEEPMSPEERKSMIDGFVGSLRALAENSTDGANE